MCVSEENVGVSDSEVLRKGYAQIREAGMAVSGRTGFSWDDAMTVTENIIFLLSHLELSLSEKDTEF
ncbi:MAG: S-phase kinase-associated protein [Pantoea sp.]|jgi:hypothetical protein|uniref:hypothetical protein n=1 Tax=unclassified Pantoea TaxID=2630326 RepID=UPI0001B400F8|nr:hypothetical protein [Pantoea sp. At-9b]ADU72163.1 S-phase kinase-associated protein [Pantoea sp. At-9b]